MRKKLALFVSLALVIVIAVYAMPNTTTAQQASGEAPAPTKVQTAQAKTQSLPSYFDSIGSLEAGEQVLVSAEVGGKVEALSFDSGQRVQKGQRLVTLNSAPERAEADHQRALAARAQKRLQRIRQLIPAGAVAKEDLDNAQADLDAAKAMLAKVEAVIAQKTITAPFAGQLGIRKVHVGQYVNPGDTLASLIDLSELRVNFSLDEHASAQVHQGQAVLLSFSALPDQTYSARITTLDPLLDSTRMTRVQAILTEAPPALRPGMSADVRVVRASAAPALVVPTTAIVSSAYGDVVYRITRHEQRAQVHRVAVKTGARNEGWQVIAEGLEPGDEVVEVGQNRLSDGQDVQPVPSPAPVQAARQGAAHALH